MDKEQLTEQLKADIQQHLENLTERVVVALKATMEEYHSPDLHLHDFEYEMQDLTRGFPIHWYPMDKDVSQLDGDPCILHDVSYTVPREIIDAYKDAGINTDQVAFSLIIEWFSACWRKAGGENCLYPDFILRHDGH